MEKKREYLYLKYLPIDRKISNSTQWRCKISWRGWEYKNFKAESVSKKKKVVFLLLRNESRNLVNFSSQKPLNVLDQNFPTVRLLRGL